MGREMGAYDPEFEAVWKALREQAKEIVAKGAAKLALPSSMCPNS
jgi:hypothetical protein